ncbi:hypothetical protein LX36DRAFT_654626 [Colletotrichum falcatum]|nr:hypothetical protein LX36DRAFT_654626 [Colletotrichum falcatum]
MPIPRGRMTRDAHLEDVRPGQYSLRNTQQHWSQRKYHVRTHNQNMELPRARYDECARTRPRGDRPATTWLASDAVAPSHSHRLWQPVKPRS